MTVHAGMDAADGTDTGTVLSQGDAAHHGPQARALGTTGAGVKVGVISDSINQVERRRGRSQATGNLPAGVTVLADDTGPAPSTRAGRWPRSSTTRRPGITEMYFSTGTVSAAGKAASINNLVAAGVKVIADDIFYLDEPMFQDGQVAQAVDAAKAAGVTYFASAGNRARQSWEGTLTRRAPTTTSTPGPAWTRSRRWAPSPTARRSSRCSGPSRGATATTDLALDFYVDGVLVARPARHNNIATGIPNEFEGIAISGTHTLGIGIRRVAGAGTPFMKYIVGGMPSVHGRRVPHQLQRDQPRRGLGGRLAGRGGQPMGDADDARAVQLTGSVDHPAVHRGGRAHGAGRPPQAGAGGGGRGVDDRARPLDVLRHQRRHPERGGHRHPGPLGTPSLTASQVGHDHDRPDQRARLHHGGRPAGPTAGPGFIMADLRRRRPLDTSPPTVSGALSPAAPNGANGWYTVPVTVTWTVADPQTAVPSQTGCASVLGPPDGTQTLTCTATSIGGTGHGLGDGQAGLDRADRDEVPRDSRRSTSTARSRRRRRSRARPPTPGLGRRPAASSSGLKKKKGKHTLTATATNDAGLVTSTAKFKYKIL